jgi:murein DD-endopeptidase MepM/ murein hydrolase activator NlpD
MIRKWLWSVGALSVVTSAWMASAVDPHSAATYAANANVPRPAELQPAVAFRSGNQAIDIPVEGVAVRDLRDNFGDPRVGHVHGALDIMAPQGTPVVAAVDGTLRKLYTSHLGGLTIYEFDDQQALSYYYAHLDRYANVWEGKRVRRGEVIGYVGMTGNATTPHLHFGIETLPPTKEWWKGTPVNPYPILTRSTITP